MHPYLKIALPVMLLLAFIAYPPQASRSHPPGITAPADPIQQTANGIRPWKKDDFLIRPLASFSLRARVLLTDKYWMGREASLSPVDLTLGWGKLSDSAVLSKISLTHTHRFYGWGSSELPLDPDEINAHMANMHMVPANDIIKKRLKSVRRGDIVSLKGYLIEAALPDGWSWTSSLSRDDSGGGACELVWVDELYTY